MCLCEKPLEANTEKAIEMADACRQHKVQLMDGVMWVHHVRTPRMKQVIDDGTLGRLRRVTAAFTTGCGHNPRRQHPREKGTCWRLSRRSRLLLRPLHSLGIRRFYQLRSLRLHAIIVMWNSIYQAHSGLKTNESPHSIALMIPRAAGGLRLQAPKPLLCATIS